MTALDLQYAYLERAEKHAARTASEDDDPDTHEILQRWADVLDRLGRDPMLLAEELDWPAKLRVLEGYRSRDGLDWTHPRLQLVDLQYSDVRPDKGVYHRLVAAGRMRTLLDQPEIERAVTAAPADTRAWFRGECLRRYGPSVVAASWDSVVVDLPGRPTLTRIPTLDPLRGTRNHVKALLDRCPTVVDLVRELDA
jgi:proteasome accessory factor A